MTPYLIKIMLHHHCSAAPFERADAPAYGASIEKLILEGLLKPDQHGVLQSTERGQAYILLLCQTPFPVHRWVDPRSEAAA